MKRVLSLVLVLFMSAEVVFAEANVITGGAASSSAKNVPSINAVTNTGDNSEAIDPNMLPPKVVKAIEVIKHWCNEDGEIIIPYSKKVIRWGLEELGYKKDVINRALSDGGIDWNNHALILARIYFDKNYSTSQIRKILKAEGFNESGEIAYAMTNLAKGQSNNYVNPNDYVGLTNEQKIEKLKSLGFDDNQIKQALIFIDSIE